MGCPVSFDFGRIKKVICVLLFPLPVSDTLSIGIYYFFLGSSSSFPPLSALSFFSVLSLVDSCGSVSHRVTSPTYISPTLLVGQAHRMR